jgi:hypothetical protein
LAVLHVIRATYPTETGYGGDHFFFFVNGNPVGRQDFTGAPESTGIDDTTYSITYWIYRPNDPHCCPSGGQATVRFRWDGSTLRVLDPMPGPLQT